VTTTTTKIQDFLVDHTKTKTKIEQKSKVIPYVIISVGHGADPTFLAVSPQVT